MTQVLNFQYDVWRELPEAHVQMDKLNALGGEKFVIDKLQPVYLKYGMQHIAGVSLLHRHFDLNDEKSEVLVESFSNGTSITRPLPESSEHIAHTFMLNVQQGSICHIPTEFALPDNETPDFSHLVEQLLTQKNFLLELYELLVSMGLEKVLGVNVAHRDSIRLPNRYYLKEKTSLKENVSIMGPVSEGEKIGTTSTSWMFANGYSIADCCCKGRWMCNDQ